jgi:hypothetical protein
LPASRPATGVVVHIQFHMSNRRKSLIKADLKRAELRKLLGDWILQRLRDGLDQAQALPRDVYTVTIIRNMETGAFYSESDVGNETMVTAIVMQTYVRFRSTPIKPL